MSQDVDYDTFPEDFLTLLIKLKYKCTNNVGDIELITFKNNGDVIVKRNVANLSKANDRKRNYDITSTISKSEIEAYRMIPENDYFHQIEDEKMKEKINSLENKLK
ncbi:174_t:CDS:2, partial [Racocetra fulgida]